ncbi:SMP-30/gluconolactonase/LRE family protein [Rhodohalobacter sp. 614A]|uniref:SMP-30/gluconolactonase/LRE family protein n=1 Tax=Rhodohalobacter sp. 614A TaxID=2908649 RepID=UPI001F39B6B9|nr:SMP-30/gluconolactonase/LRE family protein [Rhodohalobacter sp. 614A]
MKRILTEILPAALLIGFAALSCTQQQEQPDEMESNRLTWDSVQDTTDVLVSITGFSGPEAVRYDPDNDVYFVSNFNGDAAGDANGFISRVTPDGTIDSLRFMTGSEMHPLHGPRGMYISGDTLWAADAHGVHGFDTESGELLEFIDFTNLEPGFLNDVVLGADGYLYITDTGKSAVYRVEDGTPTVLVEDLPAPPNGITIDADNNLILAPWEGATMFPTLVVGDQGYAEYTNAQSGGNFDGIEFVNGRMIAASQADSSLHVFYEGENYITIHTPGRPADIGLDTQRMQVAVPYIALNRVDIWQLPTE